MGLLYLPFEPSSDYSKIFVRKLNSRTATVILSNIFPNNMTEMTFLLSHENTGNIFLNYFNVMPKSCISVNVLLVVIAFTFQRGSDLVGYEKLWSVI
jgi:hypothetical protein